jgi:hypothetical protein
MTNLQKQVKRRKRKRNPKPVRKQASLEINTLLKE